MKVFNVLLMHVLFVRLSFTFSPRRNCGAGFDEKSNKKIKTDEKKLKIYMAVNDMLTCAD